MTQNKTRWLHVATATLLFGATITACAVATGSSVIREPTSPETSESAEVIVTPIKTPSPTPTSKPTPSDEGITAEEARAIGSFASDGDALISGYEVRSNDKNLVVTVYVENVSEVEDMYEVQIVTEDGRESTNGGPVPAESSASFEVIIQGAVEGDVAIILNGTLMGERVDAEALNLN